MQSVLKFVHILKVAVCIPALGGKKIYYITTDVPFSTVLFTIHKMIAI